MTPENPDYNLLITVYVLLGVLYFCVQELLATYLFSDKDMEDMENNQKNQELKK